MQFLQYIYHFFGKYLDIFFISYKKYFFAGNKYIESELNN